MPIDFAEAVRKNARFFPQRTAVVCEGRRWTYRELMTNACRLANGLATLGVRSQDRVATLGANDGELVEFAVGLAVGNIVRATLYPYNAPDLNARLLDKIGAKVLLVQADLYPAIEPHLTLAPTLESVIVYGGAAPAGTLAYDTVLAEASRTDPLIRADGSDASLIRFSGGTTGFPKAMFHSVDAWRGYCNEYQWVVPPERTTMSENGPRSAPKKGSLAGLRAAALAGSTIEWFDFFIYGTAAALVFGQLFFPTSSPLVGTLLAFSTFWAGFLARPLGGLVFGHVGDKFGRKPATVICMATMGIATFAIGVMPTADTIGVFAPILLVLLRFTQGIAVGGQWGGVILMLTERTGSRRRGFAGIFGQLGVPLGLALGNASFLVMTAVTDDAAFLAWGWRVPFLVSLLLIPIAYYIHTRIEDSPTFRELKREQETTASEPTVKAPLWAVLRRHPKQILFGAGLLFGCNAFFYASVTGLISYGATVLELDPSTLLLCVMIYVIPGSLTIIAAGILSDRFGRRPVMIAGAVVMTLWGFPFFLLVDTASYALITLAVAVAAVGANLIFGPYAAYLTELFAPEVRYSGMSIAYQLSSVIVSGGTPVLMTGLIAATGSSTPVAAFLAAMGLASLGSALALRETNTEPRSRPATTLARAEAE